MGSGTRWSVEIDGKSRDVASTTDLERALACARGAREVTIELVRTQHRSRWERFLYRLLGVTLVENIPLGTLEIMLHDGLAHVVFLKNDDDEGSVAVGQIASERALFSTSAGEPVTVGADECIPAEIAFELVRQFHATKKRPSQVTWRTVG